MQYNRITFLSEFGATLLLCLAIIGCGVGHESPGRTASVEGNVVFTEYGAIVQVPAERYFIRDTIGDIVVEFDENGSFFFAVIPKSGSELQLVGGEKEVPIVLPSLEEGETVRLGLRYDITTSSLTTDSAEIDNGSDMTPTPAPPEGGSEIPVTQTPGIERPTSNSPFDSQGSTSSFGIPGGLLGNIAVGRRLYQQQCTSCHGEFGSGWRFSRLKTRIAQAPMYLFLPDRDLANIVAFLNRGSR